MTTLTGTKKRAATKVLKAEFDALNEQYDSADELPEEVDERLGELETTIATFDNRPLRFDAAEIGRAGVFISLDANGSLELDRGFIRPEDEPAVEQSPESAVEGPSTNIASGHASGAVQRAVITIGGEPDRSGSTAADDEEETIRPLSERLVVELTAHRTVALRDAVGYDFGTAFLAVLHALALNAFARFAHDTCLEISAKSTAFSAQAPGLKDAACAKRIAERHAAWQARLPMSPADLWSALAVMGDDHRQALFAHCASLSINPLHEPWDRTRNGRPTPIIWPRRSHSTWWRQDGRRRSTAISAASPKPASSKPCARRRVKVQRS